MDNIQKILKEKNVLSHQNEGIIIAKVETTHEGFSLAKEILYAVVDPKTVLYLSGGSTPKQLYTKLGEEEELKAGAVGMVDERFGEPFHDNSNEKMIQETGLLRYLQMRDIPFYSILTVISSNSEKSHGDLSSPVRRDDNKRKEASQAYDERLRILNASFQKSVAILGIGADGHTAGLPAQSSKFKIQSSKLDTNYDLVTEYNDTSGKYGERVTMTFLALAMMDVLLVLAFGSAKQNALELMFNDGSEKEIPARFFKRPDIAKKTLLITDQMV